MFSKRRKFRKTTVYTCDKCEQSKSLEDIVTVDISYQIAPHEACNRHTAGKSKSYERHTVRVNKDICKECLNKFGLLTEMPEQDRDEALKKNDKTLESKFINLLSDLGVMFEE
ncbi:MAG: hypothetical protein LBK57_03635 [Clostridiales Family XIII bacterium]|nr:hypothetical protein [Clostridiales Family XIII bacterium]